MDNGTVPNLALRAKSFQLSKKREISYCYYIYYHFIYFRAKEGGSPKKDN